MATPPPCHSPFELENNNNNYYYYNYSHGEDSSSGYLEDALLEFGDRSKRRRLSFSSPDCAHSPVYGNSGVIWDTNTTPYGGLTDELGWISIAMSKEVTNVQSEIPTSSEDAMSLSSLDSSTCSAPSVLNHKPPSNPTTNIVHPSGVVKQRVIKGVAYPFALVKPGGSEGIVTLEDINARIHMTPTRPVRHPVGDFACRPHGEGRGPSGKAVVGLTRLHTQGGRGSITIIRTKG
ncbi:hypothetical protein MLD38_011335 [Melastoma candidum]|uniref:Uncharacterized protein n=1 Tax=Melastoma candidum TaxID=119954 RepID=A0ACB9R3U7_9MYRT|nr:hypothetical protein MLD38_011335 [Melastoma candidum]